MVAGDTTDLINSPVRQDQTARALELDPRLEARRSALQHLRGRGVAAAEEDLLIAAESDSVFTIMYAPRSAAGQTFLVLIDRATGGVLDSLDLSSGQAK